MKETIRTFYQKHMVLSHLMLIMLVIIFLGVFTLFFLDVWTNHGRTTVVPEVRKKSFAEATEILDKSHLHYEIADSVYDSNTPPGTVKEVWPHPGTNVKPGRLIYLTINSFQPQRITVTMPLTGVSSRQAMTYLKSLNIKNVRLVYVPSNFPDLVEGAKYKGKSIVPGMQIPVNADVVLEVGTVPQTSKSTEDESIYSTDELDEAIAAELGSENNDSHSNNEPATADTPETPDPDVFD